MSTKSILFAEDSEDDVFLLQRSFRRAKVANPLSFMKDGREAVNYLIGVQAPPGCIVLDVKMPFRSGLEVLAWIRGQARFNDTPVLMMTSSSQDQDIREAYRLGADAYLVKPSGSTELDRFATQLSVAVDRPRTDSIWQSLPCNRPLASLSRPNKPL